jgi:PBP1b-binding outer membrane lipoprotein LpoB
MKNIVLITFITLIFSGCSATWNGIKEDTSSAADWSKKQVNGGASYVQEKTK